MKIAITGASRIIGKELFNRGCIPVLCDIVKSPNDLFGEINSIKPDVLIHCAAITDVDYCENHFKESFEVNVRGTSNVVEAMSKDSLFIYLSTDHIFSGNNWIGSGYKEDSRPSPVNRYGFSKWGGELAAQTDKCRTIIVRSSKCFNYDGVKDTIYNLQNGETVIFTDLIKRSFVHVSDFVTGLLYLTKHYQEHPKLDIINISGTGISSYYLFWSELQKYLKLPGKVIPRRSELEGATPRPFRGGLDIGLARKLSIPVYSMKEGFELIKQGI